MLKVPPAELAGRIGTLMDEHKKLARTLEETRHALATGGGGATEDAREIAGVSFVGRSLDGARPKELRAMVDDLKQRMALRLAVVSRIDGKARSRSASPTISPPRVSAVDLARAGAAAIGGKGGGGRADMAQAAGRTASAWTTRSRPSKRRCANAA